MNSQYNPFKENRAEQMKELWKYYVPIPGIDAAGKPLVVEGGRGSGKTMLFQCNSWREVSAEIRLKGLSSSTLYTNKPFVGIYYRVDTTFVSAMKGKEVNNWNSIFETYFSICILREVLDLLLILGKDNQFNELNLIEFVKSFSKRLFINTAVESLEDFKFETNLYLDEIENYINGMPKADGKLRFVNARRFIVELLAAFNNLVSREVLFKIFIDEYETLQEYQQKIMNTLIKHSTRPVIFNIGLRPDGMKTQQTISETEIIESPNDYEEMSLSIDEKEYLSILKEICKKRIILGKELGKIPASAPEDIEYYLGDYSIDEEISFLDHSNRKEQYLLRIEALIRECGEKEKLSKKFIENCVQKLCYQASLIDSKLNYILLYNKTPYSPTLKELYNDYINNTKRYNDWKHNRKFGAVFLLAKDFKKRKMYYGFKVFAALSSSIVRYFLELCEQTFRLAFLDNFQWNSPIDSKIQTEATYYVSEYKIDDIMVYEPFGKELRIFVQYLGHIFYSLHTASNTTLGEPEPNHFNTKDLALSDDLKKMLSSAIMWNVLQVRNPTKRKQSILSPETVDYYLNKVYVPYFGISYRNQRKISLSIDILKMLLSGDPELAKDAVKQYNKNSQEVEEHGTKQQKHISLFEGF